MRQQTLADNSFEKFRKKTRKEQFLDDMEQIIPWEELTKAIKPYYPKPEGTGRRPVGIERMLRIHFLQHWFELSDPGAEEALYDSRAMRRFVWVDSAYAGQGDVLRKHAPNAKDFTNQKGFRNRPLTDEGAARNRTKSNVRAKVEHLFLVLKRIFGFNKVRYRGLDKNANRLFVDCGLVNLYMTRRQFDAL